MKDKTSKGKAISLRARRGRASGRVLIAVALGIVVLFAVGAMGYHILRRPQPARVVLLIADFEGVETRGSHVSETIVRNLRAVLAPYRGVKAVALKKAISKADGSAAALAEGVRRQAAIVVWGSYDADQQAGGLNLHFELLRLPRGVPEPALTQSLGVQARPSQGLVIPTLLTAGVACYVAEDWGGASETLGGILVLSSEQPTESVLSLTYILIADAHYAKGDLAQAIANYDQALGISPDSAEALVKRGIAYGAQGDFDRAIQDFDRVIALKRDLAEAYYNSGNAYYAKRENELAIASYDQAIAKKPDYAEAYCNRGLVYASDGNYERALLDLDQAIQLEPDFVRAYSNRGSVYYAQGDYARAIADYDRVIALQPDFAEAYFNRGVTYMAQGEREKAIKDLQRFLKLSAVPSWRRLAQRKLAELGVR